MGFHKRPWYSMSGTRHPGIYRFSPSEEDSTVLGENDFREWLSRGPYFHVQFMGQHREVNAIGSIETRVGPHLVGWRRTSAGFIIITRQKIRLWWSIYSLSVTPNSITYDYALQLTAAFASNSQYCGSERARVCWDQLANDVYNNSRLRTTGP